VQDLDAEARAQARGRGWIAWQMLRIGTKLRLTFGAGALWFDLRYAVRSLVRARWFTVGAALTFALGVGINLSVFAAIDQVLFRPLPYANPSELVMLRVCARDGEGCSSGSFPDLLANEARDSLGTMGELALVGTTGSWTIPSRPDAGPVRLTVVWPNLLRVLGVRPAIGRDITADEERERRQVALLTHEVWAGRFARDAAVLGSRVGTGESQATVIGVLPPGFVLPQWGMPDPAWEGIILRSNPMVIAPIARLRPGQSRDAAQQEIDAFVATLGPQLRRPGDPPDRPLPFVRVDPLEATVFDVYTHYGWLVAVAAAIVLLMACVNLTALVLARGRSREQDAAMRTALGASRSRIVSATIIETSLVCALGAAVALVCVAWTTGAITALLPPLVARYAASAAEPRVIAWAVIVAGLGAVAAGLWPGARLARANLAEMLPRAAGSGRRLRLPGGRTLVVVETTLGVVLVAGAALAGRSFVALATEELGYDARDWYRVTFHPVDRTLPAESPLTSLSSYEQVLEAARSTPGIVGIAGGDSVIMTSGSGGTHSFSSDPTHRGVRHEISPGFFREARTELLAGREFTAEEARTRALVGVLDPAGLAQVWPGVTPASAVGRYLVLPGEPPRQIVGIAPRLIRNRRGEDIRPSLFVPLGTRPRAYFAVAIRTRPGQPPPVDALRERISARIGPRRVTASSIEEALQPALKQPRFRAVLFGAFATCALLLAVAGLYAIVSFDASLRRHEVGVRMTLGATARGIVRMVIVGALKPVLAGVLLGIAAAAWASKYLEGFLYQVDPHDPRTLAVVAATLIGAGLVAAWLPARRAARTDPAVVLKAE
jgi:predicted permease